jgi:metal iron transporter
MYYPQWRLNRVDMRYKVIGTAIALNLLLHIPLVAGCAISIIDVLIILIFYNPSGMSGRALRIFEGCVALLVLGVVVCFCFQLSLIQEVSIGEVFRGYLPSSALVKSQGYVFSCSLR